VEPHHAEDWKADAMSREISRRFAAIPVSLYNSKGLLGDPDHDLKIYKALLLRSVLY